MKTHWLLLAAILPVAAKADPVVDLTQAIQQFKKHSSYAWETTLSPAEVSVWRSAITSAVTDTNVDSKISTSANAKRMPAPIEGATDRALGSVVFASVSRLDESGSLRLRAVLRDGRGVVETRNGWRDAGELERDIQEKQGLPSTLVTSASNAELYSLRTARLEISLRAPDDELTLLLADAKPAMLIGGSLVATLNPETAANFLFELRYRDGALASETPPVSAEGAVTIWLKKGEIAKYEVAIDAVVRRGRADREVHFVKTTLLHDLGKARVKLPPPALAKLDALKSAAPSP